MKRRRRKVYRRERRAWLVYVQAEPWACWVVAADTRGCARSAIWRSARALGLYRSDFCAFGAVRLAHHDTDVRNLIPQGVNGHDVASTIAAIECRIKDGWIGCIQPVQTKET